MSGYWTDAEGSEIKIEYMTDSHLANSISFINRKAEASENFIMPVVYYELVKEYKRRMELIKNG